MFERIAAIVLSAALVFSVLAVFISSLWPIGAAQCVFFLLALAFVVRSAARRRVPAGHWLLAVLAGMAIWGMLQIPLAVSVNRFATWSSVLHFAAYGSLFFASLQIFDSRAMRGHFRVGASYFGCVLGLEAILQHFTADGRIFWMLKTEYTVFAMGPFVNRDHFAAFIELIFPLALWQALVDRERAFRFSAIAAVLFVSVVTAASRAGFAVILAELIFVLVLSGREGNRARSAVPYRAMAATLALIIGFAFIVGWDVLLDRFKAGTSDEVRWQIWQACGRMIGDRPWMGFGLGTFETSYPAYAIFDAGAGVDHAHNDWAEWTAEGGLPFLGLLIAAAGASVRMAVRYPWGIGVAAVFLHSLIDFPLQEPAVFFWLVVLLAALAREHAGGLGQADSMK